MIGGSGFLAVSVPSILPTPPTIKGLRNMKIGSIKKMIASGVIFEGYIKNRLTLVRLAGKNEQGALQALFKCSCGNYTMVKIKAVLDGNTKSCGCLRLETCWSTRPRKKVA